jgi:hypothetical protein
MITNQITTANTFSDWVGSTQAIITYLNNTETLPNDAIEIATTANNTANYANSQVDLAFINSQEAYDAANDSLIITGFAYDTANTANTTANYAYDQANTGTSIAEYANDVAIFANTRINTIYNGSEILVPTGSTTQRPVTPSTGMFRYNTDTNQFEGYATAWMPVGGVPVGAVIPFIGGYFTNGSNAGYTNVLGNTVANVNSLLNSTGWYVCNGATINLANSPIFNGANRYLPNITDSRFIMGSTSSGAIGGSNVIAHTHDISHNHTLSAHTHTMSSHVHTLSAHTHTMSSHVHTLSSHTHTINAHNHVLNGSVSAMTLAAENLPQHYHERNTSVWHPSTNREAASGSAAYSWGTTSDLNYIRGWTGTLASKTYFGGGTHNHNNTFSIATTTLTSNGPSTTNTGLNNDATAGPSTPNTGLNNDATAGPSTPNTGPSSVTNLSATNEENRPSFISCIYIMRVF